MENILRPDLSKLLEPFHHSELEWRIGHGAIGSDGKPWAIALPYVTNRCVQKRLDAVVLPENWRTEFHPVRLGDEKNRQGFMCTLYIRIDGEWIGKTDGASCTGVEPIKGGISDAQKRAAAEWGVGRYLYWLPDMWANFTKERQGKYTCLLKKNPKDKNERPQRFWWNPPRITENWANPIGDGMPPEGEGDRDGQASGPNSNGETIDEQYTRCKAHISTLTDLEGLDKLEKWIADQSKFSDDRKSYLRKSIKGQRNRIKEGEKNRPSMSVYDKCKHRIEELRTLEELQAAEDWIEGSNDLDADQKQYLKEIALPEKLRKIEEGEAQQANA